MIDNSNSDEDLGLLQKIFLVLLSLFLVALLFFFRSGFKANAMLDQLAKNSLEPDIALLNGKPTVFEFYADWCEACKEMAPDMFDAEKLYSNKIDIVLLNVDNSRWLDLIEKYNVNGIPQLTFFNDKGEFKGFSLGVRKYTELNEIFLALINNSELPSYTKLSNSSNLISKNNLKVQNNIRAEGPRYHS
ncbi:thioredoxin domain-containing protein [Prochlorococcus sp. MIT 0801]|uniref:thioredoxin domain-containing protein n=1 Tax=Prochlorococcus sp. MIT 0801 TaxID=1501269 RepID=UPI0004F79DD1|nr:thioredoxin domain-containing protein [Prochlorococcus sp. MIT 0801]AIQ96427.1 Thioredoxin-related [Prochlorococcus sp. MIT 0801]